MADTQIVTPSTASADWHLNTTIAALEGGVRARTLADGRDALALAVLQAAGVQAESDGAHVLVTPSLHAQHPALFAETLPACGIETEVVEDPDDVESWRSLLQDTTAVLLAETVADPRGDVLEFGDLTAITAEHDIALIIDNSAATPALVRPIELGADYVVHTRADHLAGTSHPAGVVVDAGTWDSGRADQHWVDVPWVDVPSAAGTLVGEADAEQILSGLQSLPVRITAQTRAAERVAEFLTGCDEVHRTYYSGLASSPCYERAGVYLRRGSGPLVTFDVRAQRRNPAAQLATAAAVAEQLDAASHPASSSHWRLTAAEQRAAGVTPGLVRLDVPAGVTAAGSVESFLIELGQALRAASTADVTVSDTVRTR